MEAKLDVMTCYLCPENRDIFQPAKVIFILPPEVYLGRLSMTLTIRWTLSPFFCVLLSTLSVPLTAGLIKSLYGSVTLKWNGEAALRR